MSAEKNSLLAQDRIVHEIKGPMRVTIFEAHGYDVSTPVVLIGLIAVAAVVATVLFVSRKRK